MEINSLYSQAVQSDKRAEIRLFENLTARFRLLVRRKVMNVHDGEEIVQEALAKFTGSEPPEDSDDADQSLS